jgi:hypothetical protein
MYLQRLTNPDLHSSPCSNLGIASLPQPSFSPAVAVEKQENGGVVLSRLPEEQLPLAGRNTP